MAEVVSKLKKVGVALGTGTFPAAAASFTRGLYVESFDCSPAQDVKPVGDIRGTLATIRTTRGVIDFKAKLEMPLDCGDGYGAHIGDFLGSLLGNDTGSIVTAGTYKHRLSLNDTAEPSWLNLWTDKDPVVKQYYGFRPGSCKISLAAKDGQIKVSVDGALVATIDGYASQTLTYTNEQILTAHDATVVTLGGASVTSFEKIDIEIKRGQEPQHFVGSTRNIGALRSGKDFEIILSAESVVFADETELDKFKANTAAAFEIKLVSPSGAYIDFVFGTMQYQKFDGPALKGSDILTQSLAALVTGLSTTFYVDIQNGYGNRYDTGAMIT
jgi:hypothetical protein